MGTYESIRPCVFSSSLMKMRNESKEKLLPKQKLSLSYQKNFCQENISPNILCKSPLQRIRDKRNTWQIQQPFSQPKLHKSLSDLIKGMTRHSGNSIEDDHHLHTEGNQWADSYQQNKPSIQLKDDSEYTMQLLLQECTQTSSRTDTKFSGFFSDYNSQGQKLIEPIDRVTPGTAHFKMQGIGNSYRNNVLDFSMDSNNISRKISFDLDQSTRSFQPPQQNVDGNLSYLMESIDEFYQKIQHSLPILEMPRDTVTTRQIDSLQLSMDNHYFPEEEWIRKSTEGMKKSIELRKIEAMLDQPIKYNLVLPMDFSINNSREFITDSSIQSSKQSIELKVLKQEFKQQFDKLFVKSKPVQQQQYWKIRGNGEQKKARINKD